MNTHVAKFGVGQLITHKLFDYRGVIIDVDATFQGSNDWYQQMALTRPPKDKPWYRVLVDHATHQTYVAERNLEADSSTDPIVHPLLDQYFDSFANGRYRCTRTAN